MSTNADLEALLARAVELDEKAAELELGSDPELVAEVKAEAAELRETLDALTAADRGRLEPWEADDEEQGLAELAEFGDDDLGFELDPALVPVFGEPAPEAAAPEAPPVVEPEGVAAIKAWEPCPEHGAAERDEFKDGTASCVECGESLVERKAFDFDDFDAELDAGAVDALEAKAAGDGTDELTEIELLLARRAALGT